MQIPDKLAARRRRQTQLFLGFVLLLSFLAGARVFLDLLRVPHFPVEPEIVEAIDIQVAGELSQTVRGGVRLRAQLLRSHTRRGAFETSRASIIEVYMPDGVQTYAGMLFKLEGSFFKREGDTDYVFFAKRSRLISRGSVLAQLRARTLSYLVSLWGTSLEGELILALLVGIRPPADSLIVGYFRSTGLMFLLALSGMHLAFLLLCVEKAFFFLPFRTRSMIALILGWLFLLLVGMKASLLRGVLMYSISRLMLYWGYRGAPLMLIWLTALVHLILFPWHMWTLAFVLSYGCLVAIVLLGAWFSWGLPWLIPMLVRKGLGIAIAAGVFGLPSSYLSFGVCYPASLIGGYVLTPFILLLMGAGCLWIFYPPLGQYLARWLYTIIAFGLRSFSF